MVIFSSLCVVKCMFNLNVMSCINEYVKEYEKNMTILTKYTVGHVLFKNRNFHRFHEFLLFYMKIVSPKYVIIHCDTEVLHEFTSKIIPMK